MSIAQNIEKLRSALPFGVELVAVSKTRPAGDVALAYAAGQRAFGENRPQEMVAKRAALMAMAEASEAFGADSGGDFADIRWHQIGQLQTNKVRLIAPFVAMVESVDSARLAREISRQAVACGRVIDILLEIRIAREESKSGWDFAELVEWLEGGEWRALCGGDGGDSERECSSRDGSVCSGGTPAGGGSLQSGGRLTAAGEGSEPDSLPGSGLSGSPAGGGSLAGVRFRGVMGIATFTDDEAVVRGEFERLAAMAAELRERFFGGNPERLSAGTPERFFGAETLGLGSGGDSATSIVDSEANSGAGAGSVTVPGAVFGGGFDVISMGMSGDWPLAVECGSTEVRVGSAIFGAR
jgi:uncharacterized pyridoxal phosphate-containing UPF0001 family protein